MNSTCKNCGGKCCVNIIDVYSIDEIYYDDSLVWEIEGRGHDRAMQTNEDGYCIALKNGKCSIYDKRPEVCKLFKVGSACCIKFQSNELKSHSCEKYVIKYE